MRVTTILVFTFVVLVVAGSLYVHIDTRRFIESLPEQPSDDAARVESSEQSAGDDHTAKPDTHTPKASKPMWWDDPVPGTDSNDTTATEDPWAEALTEKTDDPEHLSLPADQSEKQQPNSNPQVSYELRLARYLERYGDIPEVHIVADGWLKLELGESMSPEEKLEFLEATYHLNPHPLTKESIEIQKLVIAGDTEGLLKYATSQPETEQPFYDVSHFFDGENHAEGFRRLRAADPKRSAEFEDFIRKQALDPASHINLADIESAIQRSYEPPTENENDF